MNKFDLYFVQTDMLGAILFGLLMLMSLLSWYCILHKSLFYWRLRQSVRAFTESFWEPRSKDERQLYAASAEQQPFARLANVALTVHADLANGGRNCDDTLLRSMSRIAGEEAVKLDKGQTVLASIAAVAPFVGLLGTVWGVHHALVAIGQTGAATLDQIAGPVGEALIMTALGLAVAIPAVLFYNAFSRSKQTIVAGMDSFAHDIHHYLTTGKPISQALKGS